MKMLTFILILILFALIFSYSKPTITAQATEGNYYCDENNIFYFPGGQFPCSEGCDKIKDCCGALDEDCCTAENSDDAECKEGLTCVNYFCKDITEEETPSDEKRTTRTARKITQENCSNIICANLNEDSCLEGDNVYCCDWDFENEVTETIPKKPGCTTPEGSITKNIPVCKNKPEPLVKIW